MSGLSGKHHGELNSVWISSSRYAELRREYAHDPLALEQIDIYEYVPDYASHLQALKRALLQRDQAAEAQEMAWFREHYPQTTDPMEEAQR